MAAMTLWEEGGGVSGSDDDDGNDGDGGSDGAGVCSVWRVMRGV